MPAGLEAPVRLGALDPVGKAALQESDGITTGDPDLEALGAQLHLDVLGATSLGRHEHQDVELADGLAPAVVLVRRAVVAVREALLRGLVGLGC